MKSILQKLALLLLFIFPSISFAAGSVDISKLAIFLNTSPVSIYAVQSSLQEVLGIDPLTTQKALIQFGAITNSEYCSAPVQNFSIPDKSQGFIALLSSVIGSNYFSQRQKRDFFECVFSGDVMQANNTIFSYASNPTKITSRINQSFQSQLLMRGDSSYYPGNSFSYSNSGGSANSTLSFFNTTPSVYRAFVSGFSRSLGISPEALKRSMIQFARTTENYICDISLSQFTNPDKVKNFANFIVSVMTSGFSADIRYQFLNCMFSNNADVVKRTNAFFTQTPTAAISILKRNVLGQSITKVDSFSDGSDIQQYLTQNQSATRATLDNIFPLFEKNDPFSTDGQDVQIGGSQANSPSNGTPNYTLQIFIDSNGKSRTVNQKNNESLDPSNNQREQRRRAPRRSARNARPSINKVYYQEDYSQNQSDYRGRGRESMGNNENRSQRRPQRQKRPRPRPVQQENQRP